VSVYIAPLKPPPKTAIPIAFPPYSIIEEQNYDTNINNQVQAGRGFPALLLLSAEQWQYLDYPDRGGDRMRNYKEPKYPPLIRTFKKDIECPGCFHIIKAGEEAHLDMEYYETKHMITYTCEECAEGDQ
jgi:RNase P subunit RPR2